MSTSTLSKNQWGFSPQNIAGCQLWLDAADTSSMVFSPGTSNVTTWKDKSGNGNNGTANGTVVWTSNGLGTNLPAMTFTNTQRFYGNISITGNQFTAFAIFNMNNSTAATGRVLSLGVNNAYDYNNNSYIVAFLRVIGTNFGNYRNGTYPTIQISLGTNELTTTWIDGTTSYVSQYGGTPATAASSGNFAISSYGIGDEAYINVDGGATFYGYISEILVYNTALTTTQRQQVEGYLAAKWGLQTNLPVTHPYCSLLSGIPGLQLWLDAADSSSITPGSGRGSISAWRDKSGNGNTLSQATSSQQPSLISSGVGGLPVVRFTGSSSTNLQTSAFTSLGTQGLTFILVEQNMTDPGSAGAAPFSFGASGSPNSGIVFQNNAGLQPLTGIAFNSSTPRIDIYYRPNTSGSGSATGYVNGTSVSVADSTTGTYSTTFAVGIRLVGNLPMSGDICELLIFNTALTTAQRQTVETYLSQKWGIALPYSGAVSVLTQPVYARPFQPVDISGCQLWLDSADFTSGATVSTWYDKSGRGNNATSAGSAITASATGLYFGGSSYLTVAGLANVLVNTPFVMFIVEKLAGTGTNQVIFGDDQITGTDGAIGFGYRSVTSFMMAFWGDDLDDTGVSGTGNTRLWSLYLPTASNRNIRRNGTVTATHTNYTRVANLVYPRIGRAWGLYGSYYYTGTISEMILYTGDIGVSQIQQVEAYLSWKWGIRSSLPSTHPGYTLPSYSAKFTPKSISGLYLWLDAADSSTLVMSGTSVTNWIDKSGNGFKATPMDSAVTIGSSQNNNPTIYLPGIRMVIPSFTWNYAFTMIIACKCVYSNMMVGFGAGVASTSAWLGYVETGNWALFYMSNPGISTTDPNYTSGGNPSSVGPANQWFIFSIGYNNGAYLTNYGINGTPYNANAMTPQTGSQTGYLMINGLPGGAYDYDNIGEIVHFNYSISTYQRQQVEGYLAWKWGIASSLPSTHPFAKISP